MKKYFLTSMLVFKNEAIYLKEWLDYHILMGVQHFYLYDNDSTDEPEKVLQWYIENDLVTYYKLPGVLGRDAECWPHRELNFQRHGNESDWMMFTDVDEFICLHNLNDNFHDVLHNFKSFPGLALRSINYGNNNQRHYTNELVIKRFYRRAFLPRTYKSIVRPHTVSGVINGHLFDFKKDIHNPYTVNIFKQRIAHKNNLWVRQVGHIKQDRAYINHYKFKSTEEFFHFKNKHPDLESDKKFFSTNKFNAGNSESNQVVARKIQFFVPYLKNNFVQNNISKIKEYHANHKEGVGPGIRDFLRSL